MHLRQPMPRATEVLIVDDDDDFRAALRQVLQDEGCRVRDAANGEGALLALRESIPDLIVLDLIMPVMNGWDFYAVIQKDPAWNDIPIAVLSGVARMRPFGPMHELHKPIDLNCLLGLLHAIEAPQDSSRAQPIRPR